MNKQILKHLRKLYKHVEYFNNFGPFPHYGSDYQEDIKTKIKEMENSKKNYDELPVVACKYCKSLHIRTDEVNNECCYRCGGQNKLIEFETIYEYNKFIKENNINIDK